MGRLRRIFDFEPSAVLGLALALAGIGFAFSPAQASGATFFVDGEAAGDPACSQSAPCTTINEAVAASRANAEVDTIKIATGLYAERVELTNPKDSALTIEGSGSGSDPGTNTVIQDGGPATYVVLALGSVGGARRASPPAACEWCTRPTRGAAPVSS